MRKGSFKDINLKIIKKKREHNKRVILLWIALFVVFSVFIYRTYDLQINQKEAYSKYFDEIRMRRIEIPAYRGNIYDRNGKLLAYTTVNRYIDISESFKGIYGSNRTDLIDDISLMTGISTIDITDAYNKNEDIKIRPDLSVTNPLIKIIYNFERKYQFEGSLSHIVGYVNRDLQGVAGIEKSFEDTLNGIPGIQQVEVDSITRQLQNTWLRKPQKGQDIYLSVDYDLQKYIETLLNEFENPAVGIVTRPKTGEVLALVSKPYYESYEMSESIPVEKWNNIVSNEDKVFLDRAISARYNPGSLIKPFMAICAIGGKEKTTYDFITGRVFCEGSFSLYSNDGTTEYKYNDWVSTGHGTVTLFEAIKKSCNVYFYNAGLEMGIDYLKSVSDTIGLDKLSNIQIPGEVEGIYPSRYWKKEFTGENWYLGDTVLSSIGQGYVQLTPIELVKLFELIALEGKKNDSFITANPFTIPQTYLSLPESHWTYLKYAMNAGASQSGGTAYPVFKDSEYKTRLASKTGTAETGEDGVYNAFFGGIYPFDDPEYCVLVLVEKGGYGGDAAAPIAKEIFDYLLLGFDDK
ncbi:MAG TPA: penicillin-binding transpeptidase domain-containing protein [Thermotogota bacterium]|nr:penicillin-binding transpeptidase domain-containing protein [Thermotogota bacterium]